MVRILIITIVIGAGLFILPESTNASCWLDPNSANCPTTYQPMVQWPGVTQQGQAGTFASYAVAIYSVAIVVAALLAVVRLVIAGVKYMTTDIVSSKGEARNDIIGSLLGLLIIISAVIILNTINPNLTTITIANPVPNPMGITGTSNGSLINWVPSLGAAALDQQCQNQTGTACQTVDCYSLSGSGLLGCEQVCASYGGTTDGTFLGKVFNGIMSNTPQTLNCSYPIDSNQQNSVAQTVDIIDQYASTYNLSIDLSTDRAAICRTPSIFNSCSSMQDSCSSGGMLPSGTGGNPQTTQINSGYLLFNEYIVVCTP